jgi:hypothetical protein
MPNMCAFSCGLNCTHMLLNFSMPTPCLPVTAPKMVGIIRIEQNQRVQLAIAGVEHLQAAQRVLLFHD